MSERHGDGNRTASLTHPPPVGTAAAHELRVVFSVDAFEPPVMVLDRASVTVGREPSDRASIRLDDRRVSRIHVVVQLGPEGWVVRDQGSHNGTWVNGIRGRDVPLRAGSVIRVGSSLLMFSERTPGLGEDSGRSELVGGSDEIRRVRGETRLAAGQPLPTLLTGETGVGKERVARELHRLSGRGGPFVALNCAAVTVALAESELFGHTAGAFTGAGRRNQGVFDAAHGGTLFLDEIGETPLDLQPKLLRALALGEVRPVGAAGAHIVDVRVVAATNRALEADVLAGRFRADLLARLSAWRIDIPPLRARREDILPLAASILARHASIPLSADAAEALLLHDWPFNVRELEHTLGGAAVRAADEKVSVIASTHLPSNLSARVAGRVPASGEAATPAPLDDYPDPAPSARELEDALARSGYNISAVAREYGKERRQIYRWIERHKLDLARRPK